MERGGFRSQIISIFDQIQYTRPSDSHALACKKMAKLRSQTKEDMFEEVFMHCLSRVLCVQQGIDAGDRCVDFVGNFYAHVARIGNGESFLYRLTTWILSGSTAGAKIVRYRIIELLVGIVPYVPFVFCNLCGEHELT